MAWVKRQYDGQWIWETQFALTSVNSTQGYKQELATVRAVLMSSALRKWPVISEEMGKRHRNWSLGVYHFSWRRLEQSTHYVGKILKWRLPFKPKPVKKTNVFENDVITIITWSPWPSFSQTQIQHDRWLLRSEDEKHCCVSRVKPPFSNSTAVAVDGASYTWHHLLVIRVQAVELWLGTWPLEVFDPSLKLLECF